MFGILNLHKPPNVTSRDVVNVVQRIVKPVKVGHAGTLDPMATGVLLVCVGKATKLISLLQRSPKTYVAEFTLGQTSDTDDSTGNVQHSESAVTPHQDQIEAALESLTGPIQQVPPAFSAVRIEGQRAYKKARRGEDVVLNAKPVTVHCIKVQHFDWPLLRVTIECGSGTYIRSIARDLGTKLGCGGLMSTLERTAIGAFTVRDAVAPSILSADNLVRHLHNPVDVVSDMAQYRCTEIDEKAVAIGNSISPQTDQWNPPLQADETEVAITSADGSRLLALAEYQAAHQRLQPRCVFDGT